MLIPAVLIRCTFMLVIAVAVCTSASAENWQNWRGPRGDGSSTDTQLPMKWDGETGHNVSWKTPLPGTGHSSPVVWGDRIFVTSCIDDVDSRVLICLDRKSGEVVWQKEVLNAKLESKHALNSYASSTPATDGNLVYIAFLEINDEQVVAPKVGKKRMIYNGKMVVAAYDFDGNEKWVVRPGKFLSAHGFCSNPVLFEDKVIINGDHDGNSYLVALDKQTGEEIWKTPRRHQTRSYVTPIIREIENEPLMVLSGSLCVAAYDPRTGQRKWNVEGPTEQFVASMVYDGKLFFAVGGFPTHHVMAIRPNGHGDVTESHVAWHETNVRCYVPSPVVVDDFLLVADDRGTANCFDTKTGKRHWQTRLGNHYSASLVTAAGLVYFLSDDGVTKILRPGTEADVIQENKLGEKAYASPAISDGQIFIRGKENLFCIAKP